MEFTIMWHLSISAVSDGEMTLYTNESIVDVKVLYMEIELP